MSFNLIVIFTCFQAVNGLDYLTDHKNDRNSESESLTNDSSDDNQGPLNITHSNPTNNDTTVGHVTGSVSLKTAGKNQTSSEALISSKVNVLNKNLGTPKLQNSEKPSGSAFMDRPTTPTSSTKEGSIKEPSTPNSAKHKNSNGSIKKGNANKKARHR
jgi:hypothetical protein